LPVDSRQPTVAADPLHRNVRKRREKSKEGEFDKKTMALRVDHRRETSTDGGQSPNGLCPVEIGSNYGSLSGFQRAGQLTISRFAAAEISRDLVIGRCNTQRKGGVK
jgi:hypothetical protein